MARVPSVNGVAPVVVSFAFVVLAIVAMAALHERHYRSRRSVILDSRLRGVEGRLETVEGILREDRLT